MGKYIGAIDQGTTSTRFIIFDQLGQIIAQAQKEHQQIFPKPGWVEHDPLEIWKNTKQVIVTALHKAKVQGRDLQAIGITNQRETVVLWDRENGQPFYNAIVWQCTRTDQICQDLIEEGGQNRFQKTTGLPVATYFSGPKVKWVLDHIPEASKAARQGKALLGTMESWLIWWLTGGPKGGVHVTDVTNASRTMLMDIGKLSWDKEILSILDIPESILPKIVPSIDPDPWGWTVQDGPLQSAVPICGALGDQQAALVGQTCFTPGEAKNTYGTGCFLLLNTGDKPVFSQNGLLTTLGYQYGQQAPVYCLEGSVAMAGAVVQWLRDNLEIISSASEVEGLARQVEDNGGLYFVPAFSGLFAPYWQAAARGMLIGLTRFCNKGHLARAALEASAFQTRDLVEAMNKDSGLELLSLKVDGGMVANELLMQFQADILDVPVSRPKVHETTCLGAAYAAGVAIGFWQDLSALKDNWQLDKSWHPQMDAQKRQTLYKHWKKAVSRTFDWLEES